MAFIDLVLPAASEYDAIGEVLVLEIALAGQIAAIVSVVDQIPLTLIILDEVDFPAYLACVGVLRSAPDIWHAWPQYTIRSTPGFPGRSPIGLLRSLLAKCPDEVASPDTDDLGFILDDDFRTSLRLDISVTHGALLHGEWKPATVIAGSVTEALLLSAAMLRDRSERTEAVSRARTTGKLLRNPDADPLKWVLHELIEVTAELSLISDLTASQC